MSQIAVLKSSLSDPRLQNKALGKDTYDVFSILKDIFVTFLTLFENFLSRRFDKVKIVKFKG